MKAVILAGGLGTRISEETATLPKPMVEIGGQPILWHIMKGYAAHGITDFIICLGYKAHVIKDYFQNYRSRHLDVTYDLKNNTTTFHANNVENWRVSLIDTGVNTMTGGRLRRVREHIGDETFCFTYGDGVSDVDITALTSFHRRHGKLLTITAVQPVGRFGTMLLHEGDDTVQSFWEKPPGDGAWISGGFFVGEPAVLDYIDGDETVWELDPIARLAREGQIRAHRHTGFWHPMDTLRDKAVLNQLWDSGSPPWRTWSGT
jgi:glucose-1-phosphate cytidylyltransferase